MSETPKPASGSVLNLRTTPEALGRLGRLAARFPLLTRHAIARVALERGLEALEADPKWFEKASQRTSAKFPSSRTVRGRLKLIGDGTGDKSPFAKITLPDGSDVYAVLDELDAAKALGLIGRDVIAKIIPRPYENAAPPPFPDEDVPAEFWVETMTAAES